MNRIESIAAVESVAVGLYDALRSEFRSPMGGAEARPEWLGEDFYRIALATHAGGLDVIVTSVTGEEGADVRVVVLDFEDRGAGDFTRDVCGREVGRVARIVAARPTVDSVWPDTEWPKSFFVSVRPEEDDS